MSKDSYCHDAFLVAFLNVEVFVAAETTRALSATIATLRFYDAAIYNATGSKFVATEHARAFLLSESNLRRRLFAVFTSS